MARIFIGLGSNLGDRLHFMHRALVEIANLQQTTVKKCSSVYETEPVGIKDQPQFLNMVVELDSTLLPKDLLRGLKEIERIIGRTNNGRWGPREIDIDLLYYNKEVIKEEKIQVPHPEIDTRRFVLVPMREIAANFQDPLRNLSISKLLQHCSDTSAVRKTSYTVSLQTKE
jgi:2-amino-4-hydroxy-6-hydroxymethyldihydropteridine diphosphokinase